MYPVVLSLTAWLVASASAQALPGSFDARTKWSNCPSIGTVPDQGCCNANYALVPTAVITDRACIQSNGTSNRVYSAYDAIACCPDCSFSLLNRCAGGDPAKVWKYLATTGLVSDSCMPYSMPPLCLGSLTCPLVCALGSLTGTVTGNRRRASEDYTLPPLEQRIQAEIYEFGPVEASFELYLDFATFENNDNNNRVYRNSGGPYLGKSSVKIIGWGTEEGTPYWLVVNTFGQSWGDNGVAKFLRGQNHLGIESNVRAARPNL